MARIPCRKPIASPCSDHSGLQTSQALYRAASPDVYGRPIPHVQHQIHIASVCLRTWRKQTRIRLLSSILRARSPHLYERMSSHLALLPHLHPSKKKSQQPRHNTSRSHEPRSHNSNSSTRQGVRARLVRYGVPDLVGGSRPAESGTPPSTAGQGYISLRLSRNKLISCLCFSSCVVGIETPFSSFKIFKRAREDSSIYVSRRTTPYHDTVPASCSKYLRYNTGCCSDVFGVAFVSV